MTDKKLEKIKKKLSDDVVQDIEALDTPGLNKLIADAEQAIATAKEERDANPKYAAAKEAVTDLSQGLKEVKSYQRAKVELALMHLKERA